MNDKLYRYIGKRIKLARRACSITQERLAEMVGVTNQHISNIEVGNKAPSYELLYAIAEFACLWHKNQSTYASPPTTVQRSQSPHHRVREQTDIRRRHT